MAGGRLIRGLILATCTLGALALPSTAAAQDFCAGPLPGDEPTPKETSSRLGFGVFPGGAAGSILPIRPPAVPEDQAKIFAALDRLRPATAPFSVHLYTEYTDDAAQNATNLDLAEAAIDLYATRGYTVEQVVRYRSAGGDVDGYAAFIRSVVQRLARKPNLKALQVTNETNFTAAPDSADGAYPMAKEALVAGVLAADEEAEDLGLSLEVGFNWFYRTVPGAEEDHWTALGTLGGDAWRAAVDWVGLDAYPGTFFPPLTDRSYGRGAMINALDVLRDCYMPLAGLGDEVDIHITENGFPTGLLYRTYEEQVRYLETMVGTVNEFRGNFNVTDYNWFTLRDGDTSSLDFQQHYGLMESDYSEKPAFASYCRLVAELSGDPGGCAASAPPAGGGPAPGTAPPDSVYQVNLERRYVKRKTCKRKKVKRGKQRKLKRCKRKRRG